MKFIIFISDNIRHGNYPRVDGFEYSQAYEKYLYAGRELSADEFNEAAQRVFNPDFRNQGFSFRPQAVEPKVVKKAAEPVIESVEEPAAEVAAELPGFRFEGRQIHYGEDRVAGLFGEDAQLRVRAEFAELRPAIEEWLESQPTP